MTKRIEELRNYQPQITTESSIAEGGRQAMRRAFVQLLEHEAGSKSGKDIEDTHQMRVATRRIRSLFRLLDTYYKPGAVSDYKKALKKLARSLGQVRDLDVQIEDLRTFARSQNGSSQSYDDVLRLLEKRREKAHQQLVAFLESKQYKTFRTRFAEFVRSPGKGAAKNANQTTPYQIRHVLPVLIHQRLAAVRAFDAVMDSSEPPLHELRIECKKLRYAVIAFEDMLGASARPFLNELKALQEELGTIQDINVAVEFYENLQATSQLNEDGRGALRIYTNHRSQALSERQQSFYETWNGFNSRTVQRQLSDSLLVLR